MPRLPSCSTSKSRSRAKTWDAMQPQRRERRPGEDGPRVDFGNHVSLRQDEGGHRWDLSLPDTGMRFQGQFVLSLCLSRTEAAVARSTPTGSPRALQKAARTHQAQFLQRLPRLGIHEGEYSATSCTTPPRLPIRKGRRLGRRHADDRGLGQEKATGHRT